MNRLLILALLLVGTVASAQDPFSEDLRTSPTPAWLPRGVMLGVGISEETIYLPSARLHWAFTITQQRIDALVATFDIGGAHAITHTDFAGLYQRNAMESLDYGVAIFGVGYRGDRGKWNWGLHVGVGPMLYRATYVPTDEPTLDLPDESNVLGWLEGRVQLGYRLTESIATGISVSYGSGLARPRAAYAYDHLGGIIFGVYADWR